MHDPIPAAIFTSLMSLVTMEAGIGLTTHKVHAVESGWVWVWVQPWSGCGCGCVGLGVGVGTALLVWHVQHSPVTPHARALFH